MVTLRTMYDATAENAAVLVPKNPTMVAIYLTGTPNIRWTSTQVQLFSHLPNVEFIRIDQGGPTAPQHMAHVIDVEPGAWRPDANMVNWLKQCTAPRPTVYCDRNDLADVMKLWKGDIWLAAPGLTVAQCQALAANNKQIVAVQNVFAGAFDSSVVIDPFWPNKAPVTPPPPPPPVTHAQAGPPPGSWQKIAIMFGLGTDGNPYYTIYNTATGKWSTPAKVI